MRWKARPKVRGPAIGDNRRRIRFAFLPVKCDGQIYVWLECYRATEVYTRIYSEFHSYGAWERVGAEVLE